MNCILYYFCLWSFLLIYQHYIPACKQGWHPSQRFNTCYKFVSSGKPWTEAQEECVKQGGNLAVVDTYAKAQNFAAIRRDTGVL